MRIFIATQSPQLAPGATLSVTLRPSKPASRRERIRARIQQYVKQRGSIQKCAVEAGERVVRSVVAVMLMAIAGLVLWHTVDTLTKRGEPICKAMEALNYLLLAIIIVEVMITVRARFDSRFECNVRQLENYLVIAITSAVRSILAIGAKCLIPLGGGQDAVPLALELAVSGAVIVGLTVALLLIHRGVETQELLASQRCGDSGA